MVLSNKLKEMAETNEADADAGEKPAFTPEMESLAASIRQKKDFYDILGVAKDATED